MESMEWEMNLIEMKELVRGYGCEIAYLQKLADRLASGARTTVLWIVMQFGTGLVVGGECVQGQFTQSMLLTMLTEVPLSTYRSKLKMQYRYFYVAEIINNKSLPNAYYLRGISHTLLGPAIYFVFFICVREQSVTCFLLGVKPGDKRESWELSRG